MPKQSRVYVNREVERTIFTKMVSHESDAHAFLIQAATGMGKTLLLEEFWMMSEQWQRGRINLKRPDYSVGDILDDLTRQLGTAQFPNFLHQYKLLEQPVGWTDLSATDGRQLFQLVKTISDHCSDDDLRDLCFYLEIDYENLAGTGKRGKVRELVAVCRRKDRLRDLTIGLQELRSDIFLRSPDMERSSSRQRRGRLRALTRTFFDDLVKLVNPQDEKPGPVVLLFDGFEAASDEVKSWLCNHLLATGNYYRWLVIVIAGQSIPQMKDDWQDWWEKQTLQRLNLDHVREYVERLELKIPPSEIKVIYADSKGVPFDVKLHVESWRSRQKTS